MTPAKVLKPIHKSKHEHKRETGITVPIVYNRLKISQKITQTRQSPAAKAQVPKIPNITVSIVYNHLKISQKIT